EVWPALTHSDQVSVWFGADVALDARPGGRGVFRWPDGTERHAVVEEVEPERKLSFRWLPFQRTAWGDVEPIPSTRVEITLDEVSWMADLGARWDDRLAALRDHVLTPKRRR